MTETPVKLMRQSTIGSGDVCDLRLGHEFWFHPEVRKGSQERAMGTAYHAILEAEATMVMTGETYDREEVALRAFQAELADAPSGFIWRDDETGNLETALEITLAGAENYIDEHFEWADTTKYQILAVEQAFTFPWINGWDAHGTADLIVMGLEDGWIRIADHKFSRLKWRKGRENARQTPQPSWYLKWIKHHWQTNSDDPHRMERQFLFKMDVSTWGTGLDFRRYSPSPTPYEMEMTETRAKLYARMVDQGPEGIYTPNTHVHLCDHRWCDHWDVCDYGERFNDQ
jgi:hypothetical protein